jgi:hypothetical protein
VIRGGDNDDVGRKLVHLQEKRADHALDLASLVNVTPFLAHGVKLVKEQNASPLPCVVEHFAKSRCCLTKVAADQALVANDQ